jgi:hypothetical protein
MIDLTDVPPTRPLPSRRRAADQELLRDVVLAEHGNAPARRRRRGVTLATATVIGVTVIGGVAAATVFLTPQPATDRTVARCYSTISSNFGEDFPGTSMANASSPGQVAPEVPPVAVQNCAAAWRAGAVTTPGTHAVPNSAGEYPVPPLVACVLPSGEAAVFPGPPSTCADLGLADLEE